VRSTCVFWSDHSRIDPTPDLAYPCDLARNMKSFVGLLFAALVIAPSLAEAIYDKWSGVVDLTPGNFDGKVKSSDGVWIVEFYAPWCGHCRNLAPEYQKAAKALKGIIGVGAIDCDQESNKPLCGQFGIQGFPTIKVFGANKNKPTDYNGERTARGIVDTAVRTMETVAKARLGGGSSGSGGGDDDVIELTDANFDKLVMKSDDMWLVEFFAPWCGHCKNLAPHWKSAASKLKGKVKLGAVDATVHQALAQRYGIQGYPTIKYFKAGKKGSPEDYDGGRTSSDIVAWAEERNVVNLPPPEIVELTGQKVLDDQCEGKQLCIIAFLPHILDSQASGRNAYIDVLKKVGEKYKNHGWGYVWTEAMAQESLEQSLGVGGFGYPALAAVSLKKGKCAVMRGSFSQDGVHEFLRDTMYGRTTTVAIQGGKLPAIKTFPAWDGKDGQLPEDEDIDLSDVELDEKVEL